MDMPIPHGRAFLLLAAFCAAISIWTSGSLFADDDDRLTPLVRAVAHARPSVVNIRGSKSVPEDTATSHVGAQQMKQVNGMGTGVVIDARGYILTNFHVVQDVTQIRVTTFDRETLNGQLVARDERTDLALLKIEPNKPLAPIPLGSSKGVMLAESVAAIGNAYGYEHTVTEGIVSELGRTVQVSDDQVYYDLIQTDAAINPGNSGGPLLNLNGEMIGINVAVRVGAQGIAFAIPVNDAIEVAADLMKGLVDREANSGLSLVTKYSDDHPSVMVTAVAPNSLADRAGLKAGDQLTEIAGKKCLRSLDVFRQLVGHSSGDEIQFEVNRDGVRQSVAANVLSTPTKESPSTPTKLAWEALGIDVVELDREAMHRINPNYDGGLRIVQVRRDSPAERENLRIGDVVVAMAEWKTETKDNLNFILRHPEIQAQKDFKFYIFRNTEPLFGQIRVAQSLD